MPEHNVEALDLTPLCAWLRYFRAVSRWYSLQLAAALIFALIIVIGSVLLTDDKFSGLLLGLVSAAAAIAAAIPVLWLLGKAMSGETPLLLLLGFYALFWLMNFSYVTFHRGPDFGLSGGGEKGVTTSNLMMLCFLFVMFVLVAIGLFGSLRLRGLRAHPILGRTLRAYRERLTIQTQLEAFRRSWRMSHFGRMALIYSGSSVILTLAAVFCIELVPIMMIKNGALSQEALVVLSIIALAVFVASIWYAPRLVLASRRLSQLGASALQQRDKRSPILFLRSFQDDETYITPTSWYRCVLSGLRRSLTIEELLVSVLRQDGPVVAIGRPGEHNRPIGAARSYHADDEWQEVIVQLLQSCQRVVLMLGSTENIAWEFAN